MKVILLAGGRSLRLKPVVDKVFLEFLGKPLIEWQLEKLVQVGLDEILIVGRDFNLAKMRAVAKKFKQRIEVIEQGKIEGMAGAIFTVEKYIKKEPVLIVNANDFVDLEIYKNVLRAAKNPYFSSIIAAKKVTEYFPGGYLSVKNVKDNQQITGIVEKPGAGKEPSKLVNLVIHYHRNSEALYKALHAAKSKKDDLYEVALSNLIKADAKMQAVIYEGTWNTIKYPWHVLDMMNLMLGKIAKKYRSGKKVEVAKSATIRGENVFLDDGVRVLDNAVIVGPAYIGKNSVVATNALVREAHVGANCVIGFGTEVARSYLGDNVWTHGNYVGDSVIGNDVSFGSGTVTGNLRLDEKNIMVNVNGEKTDSSRNKLGLITGDHVRCGINTSTMPGTKIGSNSFVGAGIVVAQDIDDNKYVYGKSELVVKENRGKSENRSANVNLSSKKKLIKK